LGKVVVVFGDVPLSVRFFDQAQLMRAAVLGGADTSVRRCSPSYLPSAAARNGEANTGHVVSNNAVVKNSPGKIFVR
jgi:hypothetical protein